MSIQVMDDIGFDKAPLAKHNPGANVNWMFWILGAGDFPTCSSVRGGAMQFHAVLCAVVR